MAALGLAAGCDYLPGKPKEEERWAPPTQVTDFNQLYAQNCAGCHGTDGRFGPARPLNDPLYLAVVNADALRQVTAKGVPGAAMPAFAEQAGGSLTDKQIDALVEGMRSRWGRPNDFKDAALPPYSLQDAIAGGSGPGDPRRGAEVFKANCSQCHGVDGRGGAKGGSVVDPNFLALVSDQSLRTTTIAGRQDLGMPDWRANAPNHPMSPQDISDVVAWLVSQRRNTFASGREPTNDQVSAAVKTGDRRQ
jgi:cytochrome c oxidase cbb3-type subunit 3/ubiquinol-cytochrome c reductase cytochrome c subunit